MLDVAKRLAIGLVLLLGGLSTLAFLVTPALDRYRVPVADALAARLGTAVSIGRLAARWHPFGPVLRLEDVQFGTGTEAVRFQRAELDLHWPGLLPGVKTGPLRLTMKGVQIRLVREPSGQLHVVGLPLSNARGGKAEWALGMQVRLTDAAVIWHDRKHGREPLRLYPVAAAFAGAPGAWRVAASIQSPHGRLAAKAMVEGDLSGLDWAGFASLELRDLDIAALAGDYLPTHYRLGGMRVDGTLDSHWQAARPVEVRGPLRVEDLELAGDATVRFERVASTLAYSRTDKGWRLQLDDLEIVRAGRSWPRTRLGATFAKSPQGKISLDLGADFLRLEDLIAVLMVRVPWAELDEAASELEPGGDLRDLRVQVDLCPEAFDWRAAAHFDSLHIRQADDIPGVTNLSGSVRARPEHIQLELASSDLAFDFGKLFPAPLEQVRLFGRADWYAEPQGGWSLVSPNLQLATPHLDSTTRLAVHARPDTTLFLDLGGEFEAPDATAAGRYYPIDIMRPQLVEWLDRAIVQGGIENGKWILHGPAEDFPFDQTANGHFEVLFDTQDLTLAYQVGWPALEQLDAKVRFHNNSLDIDVTDARIYDSELRGVRAVIPQLDPALPVEIVGEAMGPLSDPLRLLAESPLRAQFGTLVEGLKAEGRSRLRLDLAVPVDELGDYRLDGALRFAGNRLELVDWRLPLTDIQGVLAFDLDAVRAQGLRARGLGTDLTVDVMPGPTGGTRIATRGQFDASELQRQLPELPLQWAKGRSGFEVNVGVPAVDAPPDAPVWLDVRSALQGIAVELPTPFGKAADEPRDLLVRVPVAGSGDALELSYGSLLSARLASGLKRGEIRLGGGSAVLPEDDRLRVSGRLEVLDATAWQRSLEKLLPADIAAEAATLPRLDVDVRLDRLLLERAEVPDLRLKLRRREGRWAGDLDSPVIAGTFEVPDDWDREPVVVALDRLTIDADLARAEVEGDREPAVAVDPRGWPALDLRSGSLVVDRADLGVLALRLRRSAQGLSSETLELEGPLGSFRGTLSWRHEAAGVVSSLSGELSTPSLGDLLDRLGFTPQVNGAPADVDLALHWAGDPSQLSRAGLNGRLELALGSGRFLDIDPGVTRVVGLLNISALQRRLRLDFSDLFQKGFSFDRISGSFTLDSGDAYTNDLNIVGPSGTIEIAGRTGISAQDFDQLVTLTPRMDATLPVAGTIVGGPVTGLAVLLAQQLMSEEVDRINRFQYSVKGPWNSPDVTALDTGGSLSKLLRPFTGAQYSPSQWPSEGFDTDATSSTRGDGTPPGDVPAESWQKPEGSLLERWLERLEPTGSGVNLLDRTQ